jgi:hypothetical protein
VRKKVFVHENIFIGSWTEWLKPHVRILNGHTKQRFFRFRKVEDDKVQMWYKKNEIDDWKGHSLSVDNSFGLELFFSRPDVTTNLLPSIPPQKIDDAILRSIRELFRWMDQSSRNWWLHYITNEVCIHSPQIDIHTPVN